MIWLGIFFYTLMIDKKITKLEKMLQIHNQNNSENSQNNGVKNE